MYAPKAGQEFQGYPPVYPPPQQIATGYAQTPQPQVPYVQPPQPQNPYAHPQNPYVQQPPPPPPQQWGSHHPPQQWSSGLCACSEDPSNCCLTCCCPCITFGRIAEIVDEGSPPCAVSGAIYAALLYFTGLACCYSCVYRTKMRANFNLTETPCVDCLVHWCCDLCALCQEYRELKHRGYDPSLGWNRNLQRQQREMGTAMTPPVNTTMTR